MSLRRGRLEGSDQCFAGIYQKSPHGRGNGLPFETGQLVMKIKVKAESMSMGKGERKGVKKSGLAEDLSAIGSSGMSAIFLQLSVEVPFADVQDSSRLGPVPTDPFQNRKDIPLLDFPKGKGVPLPWNLQEVHLGL
jgi:hypothetical protein